MNRFSRNCLAVSATFSIFIAAHCPAYEVFIGGFNKQEQLLDVQSWAWVAEHCDGYFNHPNGLQKLSLAERKQIATALKNKRVIVEANNSRRVSPWTDGPDPALPEKMSLTAAGFIPYGAFIAAGGIPTDTWNILAKGYRDHGYSNCFIMTGISVGSKGEGWKDPRNDQTRSLIREPISAGVGTDQPVNLFLTNEKWRQSTLEQIDWTHKLGKQYLYLISPNSSGPDFLSNSQKTVREFEKNGLSPDIYAIEHYRVGYDMTPETVRSEGGQMVPANSVTGIAYWLLHHRDGSPGFADLTAQDSNNVVTGSEVMASKLVSEQQVVRLPATGSKAMTYTLSIVSKDPVIDYAPVISAEVTGTTQEWTPTFIADGKNVTSDVLKGGYSFVGDAALQPKSTRRLTMILTPNPGAASSGDAHIAVVLRANRSSALVRDGLMFTSAKTAVTAP